ncbi:hypothetical protein ATANTOWER_023767 [Ataeniobius toweri]|uniref:Uncharacterized protein n=1 Tax=Ataeniobius toweri TaxID=208326 RepID=A0ABU7CBG1_9TELE|nr:hypothetical protein [Ataeniobius toweri]
MLRELNWMESYFSGFRGGLVLCSLLLSIEKVCVDFCNVHLCTCQVVCKTLRRKTFVLNHASYMKLQVRELQPLCCLGLPLVRAGSAFPEAIAGLQFPKKLSLTRIDQEKVQ